MLWLLTKTKLSFIEPDLSVYKAEHLLLKNITYLLIDIKAQKLDGVLML